MQLTFDADVEAFRAEFVEFLDGRLPEVFGSGKVLDRPRSSSDVPQWARRWQRLLFDNGWLLPGNPAEFGPGSTGVVPETPQALVPVSVSALLKEV